MYCCSGSYFFFLFEEIQNDRYGLAFGSLLDTAIYFRIQLLNASGQNARRHPLQHRLLLLIVRTELRFEQSPYYLARQY